ncbi:MAG TPA: glycosyltransferase family 9 protein, partial [Ignavibacteriaceae bacterium]
VFDGQKIKGYDFENVIKIDSVLLRQAFSIANKCDVIIGPDSSFIHFAAAFDKPTIALFGPIDGSVRTMNYLNCVFIDVRDELGCLPCWRNESMPCKLTGMRNSICMESIKISKVVDELNKIIERKNK